MIQFDDFIYKIIGNNIKTRREIFGLKQSDLSDSIGIARSSISHIESGRQQTPLHVLYKIAERLGTDINSLLPSKQQLAKHIVADKEIGKQLDLFNRNDLKSDTIEQISKLLNNER